MDNHYDSAPASESYNAREAAYLAGECEHWDTSGGECDWCGEKVA